MKQALTKILIPFIIIRCFTSCDAVKRIPNNEYLLTDNSIIINGNKSHFDSINDQLFQQTNKKILDIPFGLHLYNTARPNKDSLFQAWLNKKPKRIQHLKNIYSQKQVNKIEQNVIGFNKWIKNTGEAPVILNKDLTRKSIIRLNNYYINHGWFDVKTDYSIIKNKNKRAEIEYRINTGKAFILDSITSTIKTPDIDTLYKKIKTKSLIKKGLQFNTSHFEKERERISKALRNSGIYHFNQDYINYEIDTIGTNKKVNVDIQIQNRAIRTADSIRREPFKVFYVEDVNIITDYSFENRGKAFKDSISYNGYKLYAYNKINYRPKSITDAIFINPSSIFRDIDRTRTYRYINGLRTFKYPNIEYTEKSRNTLTDTIRLTPLKKFTLGFSTDVSQSNIQKVGLSANPSLLIRNIFKGTETLELSGIASIGSSAEAKNEADPFFDINEIGVNLRLTIPRILSPFYTENMIPRYMSPSTRMSVSTTSQTNIGLDKQTLMGSFNFNWYPNTKTTNKLSLLDVQYIRNLNASNYFGVYNNSYNVLNEMAKELNFINSEENLNLTNSTSPNVSEFIDYITNNTTPLNVSDTQVKTVNNINERKNRLTENNLILSSSFSYKNDNRNNIFDNNFSIFRFKLELAGNLLANISNLIDLNEDNQGRYEFFNVAFSQYAKTELNHIKHWDFGKKNVLAIRSFFGIAIPYGNSTNIPFAKSFFAGGPNDNRAWSAYNLGPGSSDTTNEFNEANLKLAFNVEHRFNFFKDLYGAFFIDAGNIWNVFDDVEDEQAVFSNLNSLKDIAIGSGFGLRYDFSFFVFRFDIGFKTYDPSYRDLNRWFNDYDFKSAVYNIGINYPF